MTDEDLRALLDAATKGPWKTHLIDDTTVLGKDGFEVCCTFPNGGKDDDIDFHSPVEIHEANARLIAAAPDLAAEVLRLRAENARLREAAGPFGRYLDVHPLDLNYGGDPLPDGQTVGWIYLTVGDFRRARAALGDAP